MRAHGFGATVVLGTDICEMPALDAPAAGLRAPLLVMPLSSGWLNPSSLLRKAPAAVRHCVPEKEFLESDQCRIVAQIFLPRENLSAEFFAEANIQSATPSGCQVARR